MISGKFLDDLILFTPKRDACILKGTTLFSRVVSLISFLSSLSLFLLNRLEGKHLPLPPAMNGTQWGQATMARNLERNCPSNKPCANVICPDPFECVDLWNEYECT